MTMCDPNAERELRDAIAKAVDSPIIGRYVVVFESVEEDGHSCIGRLPSPGLPMWMQMGMLNFEASGLVAQPIWTAEDDDEDE